MYFDKLCKIQEKWLHKPEFEEMLREARIFFFDYDPTEYIRAAEDLSPEVYEQFHLPFPCVALEDRVSVVLLKDLEENQIGAVGWRGFMELVRKGERFAAQMREVGAYSDAPEIHSALDALSRGEEIWELYYGEINIVGTRAIADAASGFPRTQMSIDPTRSWLKTIMLGSRRGPITEPIDIALNLKDTDGSSPLRNILAAYDELAATYTKKRFVLETAPAKQGKKTKKIPRVHQRPQYTLLQPRQIRDRMNLSHPGESTQTGRKKPAPHERRRHLRRLTVAGGFKEDKTIVIPAVWVGPSEAVVGNKKYKVIL